MDELRENELISFEKRVAFLQHLSKHGHVGNAARAAGYRDSSYVRLIRKQDKDFSEAWELAVDAFKDELEGEAIRRAKDGVKKPVIYQGQQVKVVNVATGQDEPLYEVQYSDTLMVQLLKAFDPARYGDKSKVTHEHSGRIGIALLPMKALSGDDWEKESLAMHSGQKTLADKSKPEPEIIDVEPVRVLSRS